MNVCQHKLLFSELDADVRFEVEGQSLPGHSVVSRLVLLLPALCEVGGQRLPGHSVVSRLTRLVVVLLPGQCAQAFLHCWTPAS